MRIIEEEEQQQKRFSYSELTIEQIEALLPKMNPAQKEKMKEELKRRLVRAAQEPKHSGSSKDDNPYFHPPTRNQGRKPKAVEEKEKE